MTLGEETRPQVYWPVWPQIGAITLHARSEGDAGALARALQGMLAGADPRVRVRVRPLQDVMAIALFPAQVAATLLAGLGLVGWALLGRPIDDGQMLRVLAPYTPQRARAVRYVELSGFRKPRFGPRYTARDYRAM